MKLTIRKPFKDIGLYTIERAEHENKFWFDIVKEESGFTYHRAMHSGRFSDYADVEGSAEEMLAIAEAIEKRTSVAFKRCAVYVLGEEVAFKSPRNSTRPGKCSLAEADELAAEIREKLSGNRNEISANEFVDIAEELIIYK